MDNITEKEWKKTKNQIKTRFQNELFDIDPKLQFDPIYFIMKTILDNMSY